MRMAPQTFGMVVGGLATVAARAADPPPRYLATGEQRYTAKRERCHQICDPAWYGQLSAGLQSLRVKEAN